MCQTPKIAHGFALVQSTDNNSRVLVNVDLEFKLNVLWAFLKNAFQLQTISHRWNITVQQCIILCDLIFVLVLFSSSLLLLARQLCTLLRITMMNRSQNSLEMCKPNGRPPVSHVSWEGLQMPSLLQKINIFNFLVIPRIPGAKCIICQSDKVFLVRMCV